MITDPLLAVTTVVSLSLAIRFRWEANGLRERVRQLVDQRNKARREMYDASKVGARDWERIGRAMDRIPDLPPERDETEVEPFI